MFENSFVCGLPGLSTTPFSLEQGQDVCPALRKPSVLHKVAAVRPHCV